MRFTNFASGSSGNVSFIEAGNTRILIDAGTTMKAINKGLLDVSLSLLDIDAIFITHEHRDHCSAIGPVSRKYHIPVYGTEDTLNAILSYAYIGKIDKSLFNPIKKDTEIKIGDLLVNPFSIDHDAVDPVGYRVSYDDKNVACVTDLGMYNEYTLENLKNLNAILVESNHDYDMLVKGAYPYPLKRRILSKNGHLSNEDCGKLLKNIYTDRLKNVILGHLSEDNNEKILALSTVMDVSGFSEYEALITVAGRNGIDKIINI